MSEPLIAKRLAFVATEKCTLKCKLCCNYMHEYTNPAHISESVLKNDISKCFELFDHVEWLQFVGGEVFMNRDMVKIYNYCIDTYSDKFDKLIIMTNATLLPTEDETATLRRYGKRLEILISDYGHLSAKKDEFIEMLTKNNFAYRIKAYHGDIQYYGGWYNNTNIEDLGESFEDIKSKLYQCHQVGLQNMHCYNGQLHPCSVSAFLSNLKKVIPGKVDYIDLNDDRVSIKEKRVLLQNFHKIPVEACRFCKFKNAETAERFPAAAQR